MRILLVEDHKDSAEFMCRLLRMYGHQVVTADCAAKGYSLCLNERFDLLICDLTLPDEDGWDFMRRLRLRCDIPAIAVSGMAYASDIQKSRDAGFESHLSKPIDIELLKGVLIRVTRPVTLIPA
jgi:two-component system CheB/CheR fusion protein